MGRRAYMTRLALGRSPYQDPLETSDAEDVFAEPGDEYQEQEDSPATVITATGRPKFYQQLYDSRRRPSNPTSAELARQLRRAQNYVHEKVGVCYRVGPHGEKIAVQLHPLPSEKSKLYNIGKENDLGWIITSADVALTTLSSMSSVGLRHRLQTFRFYSGIPLTEVMRTEWKHFGLLKYLFAGSGAASLRYVLSASVSLAIEELVERLTVFLAMFFWGWYNQSLTARHRLFLGMWNLEMLLHMTSFIVLAPLQIYAELQCLDLMPLWPMLPPARSLIPFSPSSPFQLPKSPDALTFNSCSSFLASFAVSPAFLWWAMNRAKPLVRQKIYKYLRAALPKPQIPDKYSLKAASTDDASRNFFDIDNVPGLCNTIDNDDEERESNSVLEELAKDLQSIGRTYQKFYDRVSWLWGAGSDSGNYDDPHESEQSVAHQQEQPLDMDSLILGELVCPDCHQSNFNSVRGFTNHCRIVHSRQILIHDAATEASGEEVDTEEEGRFGQFNGGAPATPSPGPLAHSQPGYFFDNNALPTEGTVLLDPPQNPLANIELGILSSSSSSPEPRSLDTSPRLSTPREQIELAISTPTSSPAARPQRTPTADLDGAPPFPEDSPPSPGGAPPSPDNPGNSRRTSEHSLPEISIYQLHTFHRLTQLSAYPADSLATHLSSHITDILFFPLETLFVRSVALSFLSSSAAGAGAHAAATRWRSQIYPLSGWFGMGLGAGWRGVANYVGKMVLVSGLEVGFGMAVWQAGFGMCYLAGRWLFGWGKL